jgi:hypothetical protein
VTHVNGGEAPPPPKLEITTSRQFVSWLAATGGSLAFTTYQSGKVFLIGSNTGAKRLSVFERTLDRPMGMAVSGGAARHRLDEPDHHLRRCRRRRGHPGRV